MPRARMSAPFRLSESVFEQVEGQFDVLGQGLPAAREEPASPGISAGPLWPQNATGAAGEFRPHPSSWCVLYLSQRIHGG